MKRNNYLIYAATVLIVVVAMSSSVLAGAGRTGGQILDLGGGTRAAALGDAFSAVDGDVTAAFWNPSGLGIMEDKQAAISYMDYSQLFGEASAGLYYAFFTGALPLAGSGTLGTTLQLQGQGEIAITTDSPEIQRYENLGTNWAWTVSYADRLTNGLSAGISGKIIQMKLGRHSGRAYAVDLGAQYDIPIAFTPIRIGAAVQNWGTEIAFIDANQSDPLPRKFRLGTAVTLYEVGHHDLRLIGDLIAFIDKLQEDDEDGVEAFLEANPDATRDQLLADRGVGRHAFEWRHLQKSVGLEYWLSNLLALRVGYKTEPAVDRAEFSDHVTYGLGVRLLNYQFDYARIPGGGPNNQRLNVFALVLRF
jgi:hypothetical protein